MVKRHRLSEIQRRRFAGLLLKAMLPMGVLLSCASAGAEEAVVYFSLLENAPGIERIDAATSASRVGRDGASTTGSIAKDIAQARGAKLFSLRVAEPYPASYEETIERNHREAAAGEKPKLMEEPDLSTADVVFIGVPTWNMALPRAVASFMASVDWTGKTIAVFNTNAGYGEGRTVQEVQALAPGASMAGRSLAIRAEDAAESSAEVQAWLNELNLPQIASAPMPRIEAEAGGATFVIELYNTAEAKQFLGMLPMTVEMSGYGGREYYGGIEGRIRAEGEGQYSFLDGELTYCPANNTVAIFYAQTDRPHLTMAVHPMGRVVEGLDRIRSLGSSEPFAFRLVP